MDIEREAAALLQYSESLGIMFMEGLDADLFFDPEIRAVVGWSLDYFRTYGNMELAPTREALDFAFPSMPQVGRVGYSSIVYPAVGGVAPAFVVNEMKKKYAKSVMQGSMTRAATEMRDDPLLAASTLHDSAVNVLHHSMRKVDGMNYQDDLALMRSLYSKKNTNGAGAVPYFLPSLHELTGGIEKEEMHFLVGSPGTGKTWFSIPQALCAARSGHNTYFATLELSTEQIMMRLDAYECGMVSPDDYRRKRLLPQDMKLIWEAQDRIAAFDGKIHVEKVPVSKRTPEQILARAQMLGCDFVIVDQLQFVRPANSSASSKSERTEEIIYQTKEGLSGSGISLLMLHQFNREAKHYASGIAKMQDIAHSSTVEQMSDLVLAIGRNHDMETQTNQMNLATLKTRNHGPKGWCLGWELGDRAHIEEQSEIPEW